jgi:hypothetical protein
MEKWKPLRATRIVALIIVAPSLVVVPFSTRAQYVPITSSHLQDASGVPLANVAAASLNGVADATTFPGGDIGAKVNAAISSIGCGTVYIPRGKYNQTTTIMKPNCIDLKGAGGGQGTAPTTNLVWTPASGTAFVIGGLYGSSKGNISDLTITSSGGGTGSTAMYVGCNPNAAGAHCAPGIGVVVSANETLSNVTTSGFANAITFGANAYLFTCDFCFLVGNNTAIRVDANTLNANSGENIRFVNSLISDNTAYALYQPKGTTEPNWNLHFSNTSFDYNGNGKIAPIQGGFTSSEDHFEQLSGPIFDVTNGGSVRDFGSDFILTGSKGTDACFGTPDAGSTFDTSYFYSVHPVTNRFCGTADATFINLQGNNYGATSNVPNQATTGSVPVSANGTPVALFTLPTPATVATYQVVVWMNGYADEANFGAQATILMGAVSNRIIANNATQTTLTMSGSTVSVALRTGAPGTVWYSFVRVQ